MATQTALDYFQGWIDADDHDRASCDPQPDAEAEHADGERASVDQPHAQAA